MLQFVFNLEISNRNYECDRMMWMFGLMDIAH